MSVFEVLAEPNRRRILDMLRVRERAVGELVGALSVSQPAVSKHLRVLREAGLVEARVAAQQRFYRVKLEPLREIRDWVAPYEELWSSSLDSLEHRLEQVTTISPGSARSEPESDSEGDAAPDMELEEEI